MWDEFLAIIQRAFAKIALTSDDILNIIISLLVSILIGFIISQAYKVTHRGVSYETSFMTSLIILAPIVAIVMLLIQGNLVLSLGLVGSLSIIRFRTPIKDTRDMVYLFWSIAVGLGAGTYHWGMITIASLIVLILIIILYFSKYGHSKNSDYILIISGYAKPDIKLINLIIEKYTHEAKIRSQSINQDSWEIVYELPFSDPKQPIDELMEELNNIESITNISILAPQLALPA
jgi:hypothetical protein